MKEIKGMDAGPQCGSTVWYLGSAKTRECLGLSFCGGGGGGAAHPSSSWTTPTFQQPLSGMRF